MFGRTQNIDLKKLKNTFLEIDKTYFNPIEKIKKEMNWLLEKSSYLQQTIQSLAQQYQQIPAEINKLKRESSRMVREKDKKIEEMKKMEKEELGDKRKKQIEEWTKQLKTLPIEKIVAKNNKLLITTKELKVNGLGGMPEHFEPEVWEKIKNQKIGKFVIFIDFTDSTPSGLLRNVDIRNLSYSANDDYSHPFIDNGGLCYGEASQIFIEIINTSNYFDIIEFLIDFLISPYDKEAFIDWESWLSEKEENSPTVVKKIMGEFTKKLDGKPEEPNNPPIYGTGAQWITDSMAYTSSNVSGIYINDPQVETMENQAQVQQQQMAEEEITRRRRMILEQLGRVENDEI